MREPFESYAEVVAAEKDFLGIKTSIEMDIINGDYPSKVDIIELLALAEDCIGQLKFEFAP